MQLFNHLASASNAFVFIIDSLPSDLFLNKLDTEWTPRDVVAHLAWWNRNMIAACKDLQNNRMPSYYSDTPYDYRNINATAVAQFTSKEKNLLLAQLKSTLYEFNEYLKSLDPNEWDVEHGVEHPRGGKATISRIVKSLIADYETHTRQIKEWKTFKNSH